MGMFFNEDINTLFVGGTEVSAVYLGSTKVWPVGLPVGTVFNFGYTGTVQEVELPPGKYKLQCWGAQGGTSYGSSNGAGSKGGYSEGVLTLTKTTTLYVFVGGQGSRGSSTSLVNGGWNGGGASVGYSSYNSGDTDGESYPACGGGATDISTVTSSMSYSGGRTNRSSASLLARCIVAGGGAGGSYRRTEVTTSDTTTSDIQTTTIPYSSETSTRLNFWQRATVSGLPVGETVYFRFNETPASYTIQFANSSNTVLSTLTNKSSGVVPSGAAKIVYSLFYNISEGYTSSDTITATVYTKETTSSTSSSTGKSSATQQGGGTSGKGQYPGTQSSAGTGGGFGYGANQSSTNYRYCAGGGGGGWYGGGTSHSDSSTSYVNYSGGGSGFVNTSANASYRPSDYTGLQLDSGTTTAGSSSHPSTSGGTETGHSGNGYARITVIDESGSGGSTPSASIAWSATAGTWNQEGNSNAADGVAYTCESPGSSEEAAIRCTFSGVTSITFNCVYNGESNYDYLTVGDLDYGCTRNDYGTSLKGTSGTSKDITFTCDSGTHFVEFCYSKDGSVDTEPDNATVYVKSYS